MFHAPLSSDAVLWVMTLASPHSLESEWPRAPAASRELRDASALSRCAPLLDHYAQAHPGAAHLPRDILDLWRAAREDALEQEASQTRALQVLAGTADDLGTSFAVLKGHAFRRLLYPAAGVRPANDVDLLLDPPAAHAYWQALVRRGARPVQTGRADHHLPRLTVALSGAPTMVEIHHQLVPQRIYGIRTGATAGFMSRSEQFDAGFRAHVRTLSPADHMAHMYLHAMHHAFYAFRLQHLADLAYGIVAWREVIDWRRLSVVLDDLGVGRFSRALSLVVARTAHVTAPVLTPAVGDRLSGALEAMLRRGSLPLGYGPCIAERGIDRTRCAAHEVRRTLRGTQLASRRRLMARVPRSV